MDHNDNTNQYNKMAHKWYTKKSGTEDFDSKYNPQFSRRLDKQLIQRTER